MGDYQPEMGENELPYLNKCLLPGGEVITGSPENGATDGAQQLLVVFTPAISLATPSFQQSFLLLPGGVGRNLLLRQFVISSSGEKQSPPPPTFDGEYVDNLAGQRIQLVLPLPVRGLEKPIHSGCCSFHTPACTVASLTSISGDRMAFP